MGFALMPVDVRQWTMRRAFEVAVCVEGGKGCGVKMWNVEKAEFGPKHAVQRTV